MKMTITKIAGSIFILVVVASIVVFLSNKDSSKNDSLDATSTDQIEPRTIGENDIVLGDKPALYIGNPEAEVTLIEYGDFKCLSCNEFNRTVGGRLKKDYIDQGLLKIEYRNFPFIAPDSSRAARGSYCADEQGKFAEYHDAVYDYMWERYYSMGDLSKEFENVLTIDRLVSIVSINSIIKSDSLNLFRSCLNSTYYNPSIDTDVGLAQGHNVAGTPSFVIGDQKITGISNYNTFKTLIDIHLQ